MSEPVFNVSEAARAAGVSRSTLQRRRDALLAAGATVGEAGWRIPVSALLACGFSVAQPAGSEGAAGGVAGVSQGVARDTPGGVAQVPQGVAAESYGGVAEGVAGVPHDTPEGVAEGVADLRVALASAEARAQQEAARATAAEAMADERAKTIDLLSRSLRMLESGSAPVTPPPVPMRNPFEDPVDSLPANPWRDVARRPLPEPHHWWQFWK
jgi:hypothetical protein